MANQYTTSGHLNNINGIRFHLKQNMKTKFICLAIVLLTCFGNVIAQKNYTISGYVRDSTNGEELIGATVLIKEIAATATITNAYGFYSITIPEGNYSIIAQYVGYNMKMVHVELNHNTKIDFSLPEKSTSLNTVVVTDVKRDENITNTQMGITKLDIKEIDKIPVIFGEQDVLKTLQLMPGVQSAGDGNSGFYVRGGTADQNLILLDEAAVYNPSHLLGFFSTFNSDAIKDVTLYKGTAPAQYRSEENTSE